LYSGPKEFQELQFQMAAKEGWGKGIYLFSFLKIIGSPEKQAVPREKRAASVSSPAEIPAYPTVL